MSAAVIRELHRTNCPVTAADAIPRTGISRGHGNMVVLLDFAFRENIGSG